MTKLTPKDLKEIITDPREVVAELGNTIIGQEDAKKALAILSMNRSMTLLAKFGLFGENEDFNIHKTNVLLIGDTGTGKTSLMKALSKVIDVPVTVFDCTSITEAGYIGGKVEDILERHMDNHLKFYSNKFFDFEDLRADLDGREVSRLIFETGIIYIDEIDKLAKRDKTGTKVNEERVQNELLKFLEGMQVDVGAQGTNAYGKKGKNTLNTKDLFFVMGGAFQGLDDVIKNRINKKSSIGFNTELKSTDEDREQLMKSVRTEDLIEYGFKPEFIGRIPIRVGLQSMTVELLENIIQNSDDSPLVRYRNFFKPFGVTLWLDDSGVKAIAERAIILKTGARSLNNIFFDIFNDALFNIMDQDKDIVIDRDFIEKGTAS